MTLQWSTPVNIYHFQFDHLEYTSKFKSWDENKMSSIKKNQNQNQNTTF